MLVPQILEVFVKLYGNEPRRLRHKSPDSVGCNGNVRHGNASDEGNEALLSLSRPRFATQCFS